jgi:hypothetical protein
MRDLTNPAGSPGSPKGLAFEIAELCLIKRWADRHAVRIVVRLDHGAAVAEDYEEVIAFQTGTSPLCQLIMWRNATTVFLQPLIGREHRYQSVASALDSLRPKPAEQNLINTPEPSRPATVGAQQSRTGKPRQPRNL